MAQNLLLWFLVYLTGVNLAAFFLYGLDKYRARRKQWLHPRAHPVAVGVSGRLRRGGSWYGAVSP